MQSRALAMRAVLKDRAIAGFDMKRRTPGRFGIGALGLLTVIAASAADSAVHVAKHAAPVAATGHLMAFGGRSAAQLHSAIGGKLDAALADLSRHTNRVRPGHALEDLHSLNPAARFTQTANDAVPLIAVDAVTRGNPQQLKAALVGLGLQRPAVYANDVGGWLPVNQINAAAARAEVVAIRAALVRTRAAPITTQGDFAQASNVVRTTYPTLNGTGVTVGILSDSFNCYGVYDQPDSGVPASGPQGYAPYGFATDDATFDETQGYLPASVNLLEEATCTQYGQPLELPFTDEGRAMMQIVHIVAPGAALAFYTAFNSEADFANGIGALATAGATVIADDTGYFDEPFFQDGILAQAIDAVEAKGVAYFSAAGNDGQQSYENTAPSFATAGSGENAGEHLLNFDTSGATTTTALPVTIPELFPGEFIGLIVEWDQPYVTGAPGSPGASSEIDLCVTGASGYTVVNLDGDSVTCTGPNATGTDAVQVLILGNPANANGNTASQQVNLVIGLVSSTPVPGRIKLVVADDGAGSVIDPSFDTHSPTLQGHPGAAGAAAVAAAFFAQTPRCGTSPAVLETYSAEGGEPILFDDSGTRLTTPVVRQKPDVTAPDGVNTSFFGFPLSDSGITDNSTVSACQNDATYLNYFGTSAATPHAAAVAALALQAIPTLTPTQIYDALHTTATAMGNPSPNYESGYGFLDAEAALASLPTGAALTLASTTITPGSSTTLSWVAINATSCTASGAWSGTQATTGSQTVAPAAAGSYAYTLTCSGAAGEAKDTATLQVQAAASPSPGSSGGGGSFGAATLLALCAFALARLLRATQRQAPAPVRAGS
jgi:Subtilase family